MCQEDLIAELLEDIYICFKDKMAPEKEEEPEPDYDLDFSEIVVPLNDQDGEMTRMAMM